MTLSPAPAMAECNEILGRVHSLESFGLVDGPGVRFVVFLQGCAMRCQYCHNPETWQGGGESWAADKLFDHLYRYHNYWKDNGGLTVSGGEPLLQLDFVTALFRLAKNKGVHTTLDSSGQPFCNDAAYLTRFDALLRHTDLVMLDIKEMDDTKHRALTGHSNRNILAMARYLSDHGIALWVRHVLVPGLTDDEDGLRALDAFVQTLATVQRVEVLPYHTLGVAQWQRLGLTYPLAGVAPPAPKAVQRAEELLHVERYCQWQHS